MAVEPGKTISFRPSEYDARILDLIQEKNPHIDNVIGLLREAFRRWEIESLDENSKSKRLARMEQRLERVEATLDKVLEALTNDISDYTDHA